MFEKQKKAPPPVLVELDDQLDMSAPTPEAQLDADARSGGVLLSPHRIQLDQLVELVPFDEELVELDGEAEATRLLLRCLCVWPLAEDEEELGPPASLQQRQPPTHINKRTLHALLYLLDSVDCGTICLRTGSRTQDQVRGGRVCVIQKWTLSSTL